MNFRPLKFRVWDKIGCEWLFPNPNMADWSGGGKKSICFWCYKDTGLGVHSLSDSTVEITQFTGLTDSKGRDIYEGDIVTYDTGDSFENEHYAKLLTSEVRWEADRWRIAYAANCYYWHNMTVIDNIFESPNLLK